MLRASIAAENGCRATFWRMAGRQCASVQRVDLGLALHPLDGFGGVYKKVPRLGATTSESTLLTIPILSGGTILDIRLNA
jgi:hypothetical protein